MLHLGDTPAAGHYITVAWHETPGGTWWLYDDSRRILADANLVDGVGAYRDCDNVKTYCFALREDVILWRIRLQDIS